MAALNINQVSANAGTSRDCNRSTESSVSHASQTIISPADKVNTSGTNPFHDIVERSRTNERRVSFSPEKDLDYNSSGEDTTQPIK